MRVPVPVTTRRRRPDEVDGEHYAFVDRRSFDRLAATGRLLEWAELGGNRYGTPRGPVEAWLAAGEPVLVALDPAGARLVKAAMPDARLVHLGTPAPDGFDAAVAVDTAVRAAGELVGLLGSSCLTPARPPVGG